MNCERCQVYFSSKNNLLVHLRKAQPCTIVSAFNKTSSDDSDIVHVDLEADINRAQLIERLSKQKPIRDVHYNCKYCQKYFNHQSNMYVHKKTCNKEKAERYVTAESATCKEAVDNRLERHEPWAITSKAPSDNKAGMELITECEKTKQSEFMAKQTYEKKQSKWNCSLKL